MGRKNKKKQQKTKIRVESASDTQELSSHETVVEVETETEEMNDFFLNEAFINEMKKGSYESHLKSVADLVIENTEHIVGENIKTNFETISTFKNHAIIADDCSNMYRVQFEQTDKGYAFVKSEKVDDLKKLTVEDVEGKLIAQATNSLADSIANNSLECENSFKESFGRLINFKSNLRVEGFVNLRDSLRMTK